MDPGFLRFFKNETDCMKANVTKYIAALVAVFALILPAHAQSKMAVVDLKKVFDNYWRTKVADTQLKESAGGLWNTDRIKQKCTFCNILSIHSD